MIFVEISEVESSDRRVLALVAFRGDDDRLGLLCGFQAQVSGPHVLPLKLEARENGLG